MGTPSTQPSLSHLFLSAIGLKKRIKSTSILECLYGPGKETVTKVPLSKKCGKRVEMYTNTLFPFRVPGMHLNRSKYHSASGVHSLVKMHLKHEDVALPLQNT